MEGNKIKHSNEVNNLAIIILSRDGEEPSKCFPSSAFGCIKGQTEHNRIGGIEETGKDLGHQPFLIPDNSEYRENYTESLK